MYSLFGSIQLFPARINDLLNKPENEQKQLEFELVETPEEARSETPPENARLLSDKNAVARDEYQKNDKPEGDPYLEGDFDFKNLPVMPVEPAPLTEQAHEQKDELSKQNQLTESSSNRYVYQKFSRQELLKKNESAPNYQRLDRLLYDNRKFSAEELGGFSFNTYEWNFAPYMLDMKRKVERNVFPPPAFTRMGLISGETLLRFKVMLNGAVKDLKVLKYTGHESLKETSVNAIVNSSPFKPLPADFPEDYLEVTASFTYYVKR
ncbi:MAG: energy transducer TonB [bacterium]|nr:MAG: energy transducer TonB [bacterium]